MRVSTLEQASSGLGLAAQRREIEQLAHRHELELVALEEDAGVSGSLPAEERPGLSRALERLGRGDTLLVAHVDRFGRNLSEGVRLIDDFSARGVILRSASVSLEGDSPVMWLLVVILLAIAEFQLRTGRSRTRSALTAKRARGERTGAIPFGFELGQNGQLVEDLEEKAVLALMLGWRGAGRGLKWIARELGERGHKTKRGGAWRASSVRSILKTHEGRAQ